MRQTSVKHGSRHSLQDLVKQIHSSSDKATYQSGGRASKPNKKKGTRSRREFVRFQSLGKDLIGSMEQHAQSNACD